MTTTVNTKRRLVLLRYWLPPCALPMRIAGEGWVVDGSFSGRVFDLTLARADILIVIERPRWLCPWRIAWRSAFGVDGTRPDLPEGCPEQFSWNLMQQATAPGLRARTTNFK